MLKRLLIQGDNMIIFLIGMIAMLVITLIEFNPLRFRDISRYRKDDKNSGIFLAIVSFLVPFISVIDDLFITNAGRIAFYEYLGILVIIAGFYIRSIAKKQLGISFNYSVARLKGRLVTDGIYRWIRHPAYLGLLLYAIGTPLFFMSKIGSILIVLVLSAIVYRINVEERFLIKTIGKEYKDYMKKTYRIIPFLY